MDEKRSALLSAATDQQGSNTRNAFNLHRVLRDVKSGVANPIWSKIYYDPLLTGGYSGIYPMSQDSETLFNFNPKTFLLREFENISIDRCTILFGAPHLGKVATQKYWNDWDVMLDWGHPEIMGEGKVYRHSVKWCNDFFLQWGCKENRLETIRLEFNPNKADLSVLPAFFSVLKSHSLEVARVSRIDVAIDYAIYLNPLCWTCKDVSKEAQYLDSSTLQTRYFGAPTSDTQIRIYNKVAELKDNGAGELDIKDFWRVEAQINKVHRENFFLQDVATISGFNPFERLGFYDPYGFDFQKQGLFSLFVATARAYGVEFAADQLDFKTRKRCLARLQECSRKLSFNAPAVIYRELFGAVYKRFVDRLQALFDLGQQKRKAIFGELGVS